MAQIYRCAYVSETAAGVQIVNTWHVAAYDQIFTTSGESAAAVRDALNTALTTKYRALLATDTNLLALVVREELAPTDTNVPDEASATIGLAGTQAIGTDRPPPALCLLSTFYTNAAIRSGHGRMFLPGSCNAGALDANGNWQATGTWWTTTVPAFLTELKASHSTGSGNAGHDLRQVVYSRTRRGDGRPGYYFDVQSYNMRQKAHWLRSRMTSP
jgi:hypothetical protein